MTKRKIEYWVIPPDADGEFVANMEEVLETYEKAYDPDCPVVCMDEQPVQLIGETRVPIPATPEHPERVDYEYERKGTASIFLFAEPLSGFRQATARPRRTKNDWDAQEPNERLATFLKTAQHVRPTLSIGAGSTAPDKIEIEWQREHELGAIANCEREKYSGQKRAWSN